MTILRIVHKTLHKLRVAEDTGMSDKRTVGHLSRIFWNLDRKKTLLLKSHRPIKINHWTEQNENMSSSISFHLSFTRAVSRDYLSRLENCFKFTPDVQMMLTSLSLYIVCFFIFSVLQSTGTINALEIFMHVTSLMSLTSRIANCNIMKTCCWTCKVFYLVSSFVCPPTYLPFVVSSHFFARNTIDPNSLWFHALQASRAKGTLIGI